METPEKSFLLGMEEQILLLASGIGGGGGHSSGLGDLKEQQPLPPPPPLSTAAGTRGLPGLLTATGLISCPSETTAPLLLEGSHREKRTHRGPHYLRATASHGHPKGGVGPGPCTAR